MFAVLLHLRMCGKQMNNAGRRSERISKIESRMAVIGDSVDLECLAWRSTAKDDTESQTQTDLNR